MPDEPTGLRGLHRYTWWAVPGTTAFLLVLFTVDWIVGDDLPVWAAGLAVTALAAQTAAVAVLLGRRLAAGRPRPGWLIAGSAAALVLAVLQLARHEYGLWVIAPAMMVVAAAAYLPARRRLRPVLAATVLAALPGGTIAVLVDREDVLEAVLLPPGLVAFTAWTVLGPLWAWEIAGRLNEARRLSAELAVKDERLRFAADLHDIQGHHLQVIALKSELAARLAEADPARAAAEMTEVRRLAADALRDTRAVVHGYRRTPLDEEIANATRVLAAAGIDARMSVEHADGAHALFGLVVREATTNVLRHSRARRAEVEFRVTDRARLRVTNDGAHEPSGAPGTGLRTLDERFGAAGGGLAWERDGDRFVLEASLPVEAR